ncbi:MAG: DUF4870 domain-containing protein [Anaerolineae bacterium]
MNDQDTKPLEPFELPETPPNAPSNVPINTLIPSEDRLWAALAYWSQIILPGVMPAVLLLSDQTNKNKFVRYHAVHGLAFLILSIIYIIIVSILVVGTAAILPCTLCLSWLLFLLPIVPLTYYGIQAYGGKTAIVPWLTHFLKQNKLV